MESWVSPTSFLGSVPAHGDGLSLTPNLRQGTRGARYSAGVTGTIINVAAVLAGGGVSLALGKELSAAVQSRIKIALGLMVIYAGLSTTWNAISGSFGSVLKQILIVCVALVVGNLIGKGLGFQRRLNGLGQFAKSKLAGADSANSSQFAEGFVTCTILFCVGPMAILGSIQDGLAGDFKVLAIKSVMDGLATMAFVKTFGWGCMLSAVPLLAYQGTITLCARFLEPLLALPGLMDSFSATGGLLVLTISLVILGVQKVPLADYLPALAVAPLLRWLLS